MNKDTQPSAAKSQRLRVRPREINLIRAMREAESEKIREKKESRPGRPVYAVCAGIILVAVISYAAVLLNHTQLENENNDILAQIETSQEQFEQAEQLSLENDWLAELRRNTGAKLSPLSGADSQYGYYTSELFTRIRGQFNGRITFSSIELSDGTLTLTLSAAAPSDAAEFVKRLRSDGVFTDISYSGFSSSENGETTFTIVCSLDGNSTEEGAAQ